MNNLDLNTQESIEAGFHEGNTLLYLSNFYNDPFDVIREGVQNALDENADKIVVDIDLDQGKIKIIDNGDGMSKETMTRRCRSIALSDKGGMTDKYGEKGIGNFAGLAIGKEIILRSKKKDEKQFHEIKLDKADLPNQPKLKFLLNPVKDFKPEWNYSTLLMVKGIEKGALKKLQRLSDLTDHLAMAVDEDLRRKDKPREIRIITKKKNEQGQWITEENKLEAREFPGRKEMKEINTEFGKVTFSLFLTGEKVKNPTFRVNKGKVTFLMKDLSSLYSETSDVFESGYVQGSVSVDFCNLSPSKKGFEWDKEYDVFCKAVRECTDDLREWIKSFEKKKKDDELNEIGREILDELSKYFKENPDRVPFGIKGFLKDLSKQQLMDSVIRLKEKRMKKTNVPPLKSIRKEKTERKGRDAIVTQEAKEKAKSDDKKRGLSIKFDTALGAKWRSRFQDGLIVINVSHYDFEEAERKGPKAKKVYLSMLIWFECVCLSIDNYQKSIFRNIYEDEYFPFFRSISLR